MYQVDKWHHSHKKTRRRTIWIGVLLVVIALVYLLLHIRITPKQEIKNAAPISQGYTGTRRQMIKVTKPEVSFELPNTWKEIPVTQTQFSPRYSFRDVSNAQLLDLFIDNLPQTQGINKAIVVSSSAGSIGHDAVSDNCVNFTEASKKNPQTGLAPAKWQEVDFICDMANHARAVVGTISKDGVNVLLVNGTTSGKTYKVFMTYTDNNITPDYSVFYDILNAMQFH
jgi:hypothetical protein